MKLFGICMLLSFLSLTAAVVFQYLELTALFGI